MRRTLLFFVQEYSYRTLNTYDLNERRRSPLLPVSLSLNIPTICNASFVSRKFYRRKQAEGYCLKLQQCGLTASIAPDAKFEGGEDGEGGEGGGE